LKNSQPATFLTCPFHNGPYSFVTDRPISANFELDEGAEEERKEEFVTQNRLGLQYFNTRVQKWAVLEKSITTLHEIEKN